MQTYPTVLRARDMPRRREDKMNDSWSLSFCNGEKSQKANTRNDTIYVNLKIGTETGTKTESEILDQDQD